MAKKELSFADKARQITNKYKRRLGKDFDKLDKPALEAMNRELEQLQLEQENERASLSLSTDVGEFAYGGKTKYPGGGTLVRRGGNEAIQNYSSGEPTDLIKRNVFVPYYDDEGNPYYVVPPTEANIASNDVFDTGFKTKLNRPVYGTYLDPYTSNTVQIDPFVVTTDKSGISSIPDPSPLMAERRLPKKALGSALNTFGQFLTENPNALNSQNNFYQTGVNYMPAIGQGLGAIAAFAESRRGLPTINVPDVNLQPVDLSSSRYTPELIDLTRQREAINRRAGLNRSLVRDSASNIGSGASRTANVIAGLTGVERTAGEQLNQSYLSEDVQNTSLTNAARQYNARLAAQEAATNAEIANREAIINSQNALTEAQLNRGASQYSSNLRQTGYRNLIEGFTGLGRDLQAANQYNAMIPFLGENYDIVNDPNYTPGFFQKLQGIRNRPLKVINSTNTGI